VTNILSGVILTLLTVLFLALLAFDFDITEED
jgi:hypothetical protein